MRGTPSAASQYVGRYDAIFKDLALKYASPDGERYNPNAAGLIEELTGQSLDELLRDDDEAPAPAPSAAPRPSKPGRRVGFPGQGGGEDE